MFGIIFLPENIISIELVPGLNPSILRSIVLGDNCHGLLLKSLGAGNVPTLGEYSVLPVIEEAVQNNIPVLISTRFKFMLISSGCQPRSLLADNSFGVNSSVPTSYSILTTANIGIQFSVSTPF